MEPAPKTTLRPPSKLPYVVAGVAVAAAVVAAVIFYVGRQGGEPKPVVPRAPSPDAQAPAAGAPGEPAPLAKASDADVRSLLEPASADPLFRRFLSADDVVHRVAVVADNLGEGVSPRRELAFLAPQKPFTTAAHDGKSVIDPAAYARYDAVGDAVASVDAPILGRAYRALKPILQTAYRALGYPQASIDAVLSRALGRIEAAPVREGEVAVVNEGGVWLYEDPALERLPEVEKHLLRMGPRNTRLLQTKAHELRQALGLPAPTGQAGSGR